MSLKKNSRYGGIAFDRPDWHGATILYNIFLFLLKKTISYASFFFFISVNKCIYIVCPIHNKFICSTCKY